MTPQSFVTTIFSMRKTVSIGKSIEFDDHLGLHSVSFENTRLIVFTGISGSGKSTALKFLTDHHPDFREHSHHWLWLKGKEQKSKTVRGHRLVVVDEVVNPLQLFKVSTLLRQNQTVAVASHLNPAWFRILGRRANARLYYTDTDQAKLASYLKRRNVDFSEKALTAFSAQFGVNYVDLDCVLERHPDTSLDQALSLWNKLNRLAIQPVDNGQQVLPELKYSSPA